MNANVEVTDDVDEIPVVPYDRKELARLGRAYQAARQKVAELQKQIKPMIIAGARAGEAQKTLVELSRLTRVVVNKYEGDGGIRRTHGGWQVVDTEDEP